MIKDIFMCQFSMSDSKSGYNNFFKPGILISSRPVSDNWFDWVKVVMWIYVPFKLDILFVGRVNDIKII